MKITMEKFLDLEEMILETIPHGSGIDGKWSLGIKGSRVTCANSYHQMDENGYYDGWRDFKFSIDLDSFQVKLTGGGSRNSDYLFDTLSYWFSQCKDRIAKIIGIELIDHSTADLMTAAINSWRVTVAKKYNSPAEWPERVREFSKKCNDLNIFLGSFREPYSRDYEGKK